MAEPQTRRFAVVVDLAMEGPLETMRDPQPGDNIYYRTVPAGVILAVYPEGTKLHHCHGGLLGDKYDL